MKTPTVVIIGGRPHMISAASSGSMWRGEVRTNMKPIASAPASTAARAMSGAFTPQILMRVRGTRESVARAWDAGVEREGAKGAKSSEAEMAQGTLPLIRFESFAIFAFELLAS